MHKIFNCNSVKVSYSCTENISQITNNHNNNILQLNENQECPCNCRQKDNCPMQEKCRVKNVLYKCIALTPTKPQRVYIGISEDELKKWYYNHTKGRSISHLRKCNPVGHGIVLNEYLPKEVRKRSLSTQSQSSNGFGENLIQKWVNNSCLQYSLMETGSPFPESSIISSQLSGSNTSISEFSLNNSPSRIHNEKVKKELSETA